MESATCRRGSLRLVSQSLLLTSFERWLNGLQEVNWERICLVQIRNVAVKACLCIVIRKEADVLEFTSED